MNYTKKSLAFHNSKLFQSEEIIDVHDNDMIKIFNILSETTLKHYYCSTWICVFLSENVCGIDVWPMEHYTIQTMSDNLRIIIL